VFLVGGKARNQGTHWFGGPDHGVEVLSPGDRSREKIPFYEKVGTRELLLVCRDPWSLELYQLRGKKLRQQEAATRGRCTLDKPRPLESSVLPLTYVLVPGKPRPRLRIIHRETGQEWLV